MDWREGPPRYFVPVCIKLPWGFLGGPSGYKEVPPEALPNGPIILEHPLDIPTPTPYTDCNFGGKDASRSSVDSATPASHRSIP